MKYKVLKPKKVIPFNPNQIKQLILISVLAVIVALAYLCLSQTKQSLTYTPHDYIMVKQIERDMNDLQFTQGLTFVNSTHLLESSNKQQASDIHYFHVDEVKKLEPRVYLDDIYNSKGCDIIEGYIYQLTQKERIIFIRDADSLSELERINLDLQIPESWGISHSLANSELEIYISDGSNKVYILNEEFKIKSIVEVVFFNGTAVSNLNELEYANGLLYANIYLTSYIVAINLQSATVVKYYDFNSLTEQVNLESISSYFNGIAYNSQQDSFWITGVNFPYFWEVELN